MSPRRTLLLAVSLVIVTLLVLVGPLDRSLAQDATPTVATTPAAAATSGTPTPTRTPTLTPTPTATLTGIQARLVLAQTYLDGQDFDRAAELFADVAAEDRGNMTALEGLRAALAGRAAVQATLMAPLPTDAPAATPAPETLASTVSTGLREWGGAALAALIVIVALYFLAHFLRWLLGALRELWYMRVLPLLGRPAVAPPYLIGDFTNTFGASGEGAARIVPQALTEKLIAWNQLVADKQVPVEPAPALPLGPMAWLSIFWRWLLPPPRGYRVSGLLLLGGANAHQLAVQRASLATNSVDRSATFTSINTSPEDAFKALAGEAAKWLVSPSDMEASAATAKTIRELGEAPVMTPSMVFDRSLDLLLPVRQQIAVGQVDFPFARQRMAEAQSLVQQLPSSSPLRQDLEGVLTDLRKSVPG